MWVVVFLHPLFFGKTNHQPAGMALLECSFQGFIAQSGDGQLLVTAVLGCVGDSVGCQVQGSSHYANVYFQIFLIRFAFLGKGMEDQNMACVKLGVLSSGCPHECCNFVRNPRTPTTPNSYAPRTAEYAHVVPSQQIANTKYMPFNHIKSTCVGGGTSKTSVCYCSSYW